MSVIRADGVPSDVEYHLYLEGKPLPDLFQSSEPTFLIRNDGILHILVKDSQRKMLIYSIGFSTSILPTEGFQWVPLSSNTLEVLEEFPEDVHSPRLLLMLSNDFLLPIEEISEIECEQCEVLRHELEKSQQNALKTQKDSKIAADILTADYEKHKMLVKKFQNLHSDCKKELDTYKIRYEEEKKKSGELQEKVTSLALQLEENTQKAKMREEFLEGLINEREKEYNKFQLEKTLKANERPVHTPNSENYLNVSSPLQQSLLREVPSQGRIPFKRRVLSEITPVQTDTHSFLKEYLKKTHRQGLFKKDQGNMFLFGKKKVFITVKHGNLLCRVGGGFENIEEFISKNQEGKSISPIEKPHRRNKTIDEIQASCEDLELINSDYLRSSPEIEKLTRLRMRAGSIFNN